MLYEVITDFLVIEKHHRDVLVFNVGDIADRIEGVMPVLQGIVVVPLCLQADQAEGFLVIGKLGGNIVAVDDLVALAFFIVVDVADIGRA